MPQDAHPHTHLVPEPKHGELWLNPSTYATTLLVLVADVFGDEPFPRTDDQGDEKEGWDPETLLHEVHDHWNVQAHPVCAQKLWAAYMILTTDLFFNREDYFIGLCNVLSGTLWEPDIFDPADALECAWGITEAMLLGPPEPGPDNQVISPNVGAYIRAVCEDEGILDPPPLLSFGGKPAQPNLPDDPEQIREIYRVLAARKAEVQIHIVRNLQALFRELQSLTLSNGSAKYLVTQVGKHLSNLAAG